VGDDISAPADDRRPGGHPPSADAPPTAQATELLRLLAQAPPEVRQWLAEHAVPVPEEPVPVDEDDDDVLARRRPASTADQRRGGGSVRLLVLVAVAAGVVLGVWYAGRPDEPASAAPVPTMGTAASQARTQARIAELEERVAVVPDDVAAHLELGVLLFDAERLAAAAEHWTTVTDIAPDEAEAWYNLGFYHVSVAPPDHAAARGCWERVVQIDPESELAAVARTHLVGVVGDTGAAGDGLGAGPIPDPTPRSGGE
jgi:tetratricopeptide (TPR) repeat protein